MEKLNIKKYIEYKSKINCLCETTIKNYQHFLSEFEKVKFDYLLFIKKIENCQRSTKRTYLTMIKDFYKFYKDERVNEIELPKKEKKVKPYLTYDEYATLNNVMFHKSMGKYNLLKLLLIKLLFETGIRSCEILSINLENIHENHILINGKGNKQRNIYLNEPLKELIKKYKLYGEPKKYLIELDYGELRNILKRLGNKYLNKNLTPHMFRRGYATYFISKFNNVASLSKSMGHSDISTTMNYVCQVDYSKDMLTLFE